jgi:DNA-binding GntR family transcriptional regulator
MRRARSSVRKAADGAIGSDAPRAAGLRRQTIGNQIHALLRREVITGQLLPRAALSEKDLSLRFGVSRTPVREALIKLADEGLVDTYPQYGSFVAPIKLQDVYDSQFVREALECAAVEKAAERMSADRAKTLKAVLDRQRFLHRAGDNDGFFAADEAMHALIMEIAGHPNAWRQVENAKAQMDRVRLLTIRLPRKLSSVLAEHGDIVARLAQRDGAGAVEAMRIHLRGLFRSVEILMTENAGFFAEERGGMPPEPPRAGLAAGKPAVSQSNRP